MLDAIVVKDVRGETYVIVVDNMFTTVSDVRKYLYESGGNIDVFLDSCDLSGVEVVKAKEVIEYA